MQRAGNRTALAPRERKAPRAAPDPVVVAAALPPASRLGRAAELLADRRAQARLAGFAVARSALQEAPGPAALAPHFDALVAAVKEGVHRGDKREAAAALGLAATLVAVPCVRAPQSVFAALQRTLWAAAAPGGVHPEALAPALTALGLAVFALQPESATVDSALALMEYHASRSPTASGGGGGGGGGGELQGEAARAAALRCAGLLASLKPPRDLATGVLPRWLPLLAACVAHPAHAGVRLAAGEFAALLFEAAWAAQREEEEEGATAGGGSVQAAAGSSSGGGGGGGGSSPPVSPLVHRLVAMLAPPPLPAAPTPAQWRGADCAGVGTEEEAEGGGGGGGGGGWRRGRPPRPPPLPPLRDACW